MSAQHSLCVRQRHSWAVWLLWTVDLLCRLPAKFQKILTSCRCRFSNMAYSSNPLNGRMEELRFPSIRSPEVEAPFTAGLTSSRDSNPFFASTASQSNDIRSTLQRRFTADSSKLATTRPFGQQYPSFNAPSVSVLGRRVSSVVKQSWSLVRYQ